MKKVFFTILILCIIKICEAQFYSGHQMSFGKNRVQYYQFNWQSIRFDDYDIYYNDSGEELAKYTKIYLDTYIPEIESIFGYTLNNRFIVVLYNNLSDFRQSNIGLVTGNVQSNLGGVTQISGNKVFLYFESDHEKFKIQIKKALTQICINEMLYGDLLRDKLTNSTLLSLPQWFEEGLISFISENWSVDIENKVRDGILSGKYDNINSLEDEDAKIAGHSIWYFISMEYGTTEIPNILYLTRVNKSVDNGLMYVLGLNTKYLSYEWKDYFLTRFKNDMDKNIADEKIFEESKKNTKYQNIKLNPTNSTIAYSTNIYGKIKIFIYDPLTQKNTQILKFGNKLDQITDFSHPILEWHPTGKILAYIIEKEGAIYFYQYVVDTEELRERKIIEFTKINSFAFSHDGKYIVLSAARLGIVDIYVMGLTGGKPIQITNDLADDMQPRFAENSTKIIFSSNRISDTLKIETFDSHREKANTYDIFAYDFKNNNNVLTRLTETEFDNETAPKELKKYTYLFLSDKNGIQNLYTLTYDSTISFIDTITHYRYFTTNYAITNHKTNILEYDLNLRQNKIAKIFLEDTKYYIYQNNLVLEKNNELISKIENSDYKKIYNEDLKKQQEIKLKKIEDQKRERHKSDSIAALPLDNYINPDSLTIDITNYVFEIERETPYKYIFKNKYSKKATAEENIFPKPKLYKQNFYIDYLVSQVDFGNLNESYQAFTGGPFYFTGLNMFVKLGLNDLFYDYKIIGGYRLAMNNYEVLLSVENLEKRLDKQYIFHRQVIQSNSNFSNYYSYEVQTNEAFYIIRYPFNQITSLKTTFNTRYDKAILHARDYNSMIIKDDYQVFSLVKTELIYDNVFDLGINLYDGIRAKCFGEFYQQVEGNYDFITVLGFDFRYYKKIHRSLIFATRIAASTAFGTGKLIYYLGGVDNWYTFQLFDTDNGRRFDTTVNINTNENYIYQAVATNMRGFKQNSRNGNSFVLSNTELRFPVFKYFAQRPLSSEFFNNFQLVTFFDIGTAWSGLSPLDSRNAYNQVIVNNGPVTVYVDVDRAPVIAGYGWGMRSKLFGYFFRLDWAWGIESYHIMPRTFYFSLNLDF